MIDAAALLTPVVVLAVLLLLGYAGCLTKPPRPEPRLCIAVYVPTALVVTEIVARTVLPGGATERTTVQNPIAESSEGGENRFRIFDGVLAEGTWTVAIRVTVGHDGATGTAPAEGTFVLDGSLELPCANFRVSGTPSGGGLAATFNGVTEGP